jgi:hypothetical protein
MKRLTATLTALVLAGSAGLAAADRGGHDNGRRGGHYDGHEQRHWDHHWHPGNHYGHSVKRYVYYYPGHPYSTRVYYGYDPYLPLGAALVGTAIGYTLSQTGPDCYGDCTTTTVTRTTSSSVAGCYRIERYPDGSEHRVDLPLSQCY